MNYKFSMMFSNVLFFYIHHLFQHLIFLKKLFKFSSISNKYKFFDFWGKRERLHFEREISMNVFRHVRVCRDALIIKSEIFFGQLNNMAVLITSYRSVEIYWTISLGRSIIHYPEHYFTFTVHCNNHSDIAEQITSRIIFSQ